MTQIETRGAADIAAERQRQIEKEKWSDDHDDEHDDGSLLLAAIAYAGSAFAEDDPRRRFVCVGRALSGGGAAYTDPWPTSWHGCHDKRDQHDRRRKLVIAAALIAAEIDRTDRFLAANKQQTP